MLNYPVIEETRPRTKTTNLFEKRNCNVHRRSREERALGMFMKRYQIGGNDAFLVGADEGRTRRGPLSFF